MIKYYELLSNVSLDEVNLVKDAVTKKSDNPMVYKQKLAKELVQLYHGIDAASSAEKNFIRLHRRREVPDEIEKKQIFYSSKETPNLVQIIRTLGLATSNGSAKRLIEQGGVRVNNEKIMDINYCLKPKSGTIIQVGKRTFKELYFTET
jgi:tyrosyl-tRNA synthetase